MPLFLRKLLLRGGLAVLLAGLVAGAVVLAPLASVRIEPGQKAIVLLLGRYVRTMEPGLNWRIPGLETIEREQVTNRRIDFGGAPAPGSEAQSELNEPRMLTGDQNLVDLQFFTEYRVDNVAKYRLNVLDPEVVIRETVRASMREVVGRSQVDDVIGAARGSIPQEVRQLAQEKLDAYAIGVMLTRIGLQSVDPPAEVKPAFDDVTSASQDKDRAIQDAERYRAELTQRANGEAAEVRAQAAGFRDSVIVTAQGEATRFLALLEKYRQAPQVTRSRLYLQTLENVLPRMEKVILEEGAGERLLPYLPIGRPGEGRLPETARVPDARSAEKAERP